MAAADDPKDPEASSPQASAPDPPPAEIEADSEWQEPILGGGGSHDPPPAKVEADSDWIGRADEAERADNR